MIRIAIPLAEGKLALHFGHCQQFALVDVNPTTKTIGGVEPAASSPAARAGDAAKLAASTASIVRIAPARFMSTSPAFNPYPRSKKGRRPGAAMPRGDRELPVAPYPAL